jgi:predicted outer membrane protein
MGGASAMAGPEAAAIVSSLQSDANAMALLHESNLGEIQAGQRAVREAGDSAVRAFATMMITEHTALDTQGMQLGQRLGITPALPDSTLPQLQQRELQALPSGGAGAGAGSTSTSPAGGAMTGASPSTPPGGTSPTGSPMPDSTRATGGTAGTTGAMAGHGGHNMGAAGMAMGGAPNAFDRAYIAQQVVAHARTLQLVDAAIQRGQQAELKTMLETQVRPRVQAHLEQAQQIQQRIGGQ